MRKRIQHILLIILAALLLFGVMPVSKASIKADDEETVNEVEQVAEETVTETQEEFPEVADEETEETDEAVLPAFEQEVTVGGVTVKVLAEEGVFPEGSVLKVEKVSANVESEIQEAIDQVRAGDLNVAESYTFDIKVLDGEGNEVQPADNSKVSVSFTLAQVENDNLNIQVYHIEEELKVEELEVETDGDTAVVETEGFSYYTVEFTYNNIQYVLEGDGYVKLSDLLAYVGLTGEVESYTISDTSLFDVYKGYADGPSYGTVDEMEVFVNDENGDTLYIVALVPFDTEEWMDIVIDGVTYRIIVTDEQGDSIIINGREVGLIDGIEQGENESNFTSNMPIATIWIDESRFDINDPSTRSSDAVSGGLTQAARETGVFLEGVDNLENAGTTWAHNYGDNFIALNLKKACAGMAKPGPQEEDHLFYSGPIAEFIYEGAAQDAEGNPLDICITYSNLRVNFQNNIQNNTDNPRWSELINNTAVTLWSGNAAVINGMKLNSAGDGLSYPLENSGTSNYQQRMGVVWDTVIQIKKPDGTVVNGSFYFPMVDIDVVRTGAFANINNSGKYDNYSENVFLYSDSVHAQSNIYIPGADTTDEEPDYGVKITKKENGWLFESENGFGVGTEWDSSYYTGFVTLIDNSKGVRMQNQFGGTGSAPVATYFLIGKGLTDYKLKSTCITYDAEGNQVGSLGMGTPIDAEGNVVGGRVQTTQRGNKNGLLHDSSAIINETTIVTAKGQSVLYTLTPMPGYKLKGDKIKVSSGTLDYNDGEEVEPEIIYAEDEEGNRLYPLYYKYEFEEIASNNAIHAEWEPTTLTVTKNVADSEEKEDDTFKFNIKVWNPHDDVYKYLVRATKTVEETHNEDVNEYSFFKHTRETLVDGETYLMYDGVDSFMGWDAGTRHFVRKMIDPNEKILETEFENIDIYKFKTREHPSYPTFFNVRWLNGNELLYHNAMINGVRADTITPGREEGAESYLFYATGNNPNKVRWDDSKNTYVNDLGEGRLVEFYELVTTPKTVEKTILVVQHYDFAADEDGYFTGENHDIIATEHNYYNFINKTGEPDFTAMKADGWTIECEPQSEEGDASGVNVFNLDAVMEEKGLTKIGDNTYQFSIMTEDYEGTFELDGVVPLGWNYEITEVGSGEDDDEKIGTLVGWNLIDKSDNYSIVHFDGDEEVKFTNKRMSVTIDPPVKKTVSGDTPDKNTEFRFCMEGLEGAPMPAGANDNSIIYTTTQGAGENEFGEITYYKEGVYEYDIYEVDGKAVGYTYDTTVYHLIVNVEINDDGEFVVTRTVIINDEEEVEADDTFVFEFDNPYKKTSGDDRIRYRYTPPKTGVE